jgi:ribosomal protein S18 acetylase RimI-like enzyme
MGDDRTVRPATADDIDELRRVARRSWEAVYGDTFDQETIDALLERGYTDELLAELADAADAELLVATEGGDLVGYAGAVEADEEPAADLNMYVDPDEWGRGIGSELVETARERLADAGVERVRDYVLADNDVGNAFYSDRFEKVDDREVEIAGNAYTANVYEGEVE